MRVNARETRKSAMANSKLLLLILLIAVAVSLVTSRPRSRKKKKVSFKDPSVDPICSPLRSQSDRLYVGGSFSYNKALVTINASIWMI